MYVLAFFSCTTQNNVKKYLHFQDPNSNNLNDKNINKTLVCPPNPHNITPIYASLMDFIGVIEKALKLDPG